MDMLPIDEEIEKVTPAYKLIRFWEAQLRDRGLLSISTATLIEHTIERLKQLEVNDETD